MAGKIIKKVAEAGAKAGAKAAASEGAENLGKSMVKKASNGITKNALVGSAVGSIAGAGVGGIGAIATGADEDNTKGMILMGALAGGAGGAMVGGASKMGILVKGSNYLEVRNKATTGSMFSQVTSKAGEAAEQMAKEGGKNAAVGGGAKGLLEKAKGGAVSFGDKLDNIGNNISEKMMTRHTAKIEPSIRDNIVKNMEKDYGLRDALEYANGTLGDMKVAEEASKYVRTANTIGGSAQGAIIGAASGALIGGISGGIDEDGTFIGGALKGGLIGGSLGGVAGGIGGYAGNNAKLIASAKTALA